MLISFVSLQGSPGVSVATLVLAWTWPRHAIVAECDPVGGRALAVFDPDGAHGRRGILELLLSARQMPLHRAMSAQMVTLPDGTGTHHLLPGANSIREAEGLQWRELAALFQDLETVDVLADCGRLRQHGTPRAVLTAADLTVLMVANNRNSLRAAASALEVVRDEVGVTGTDGLVVAIANQDSVVSGFPLLEIRKEFATRGVPVVGALPWDPVAAACFTDIYWPGRKFETTPLIDAARRLAGVIGRHAEETAARLRRATQPGADVPPAQPHIAGPGRLRLVPAPTPAPVPRLTRNYEFGDEGIDVH